MRCKEEMFALKEVSKVLAASTESSAAALLASIGQNDLMDVITSQQESIALQQGEVTQVLEVITSQQGTIALQHDEAKLVRRLSVACLTTFCCKHNETIATWSMK